jgi:hypothetical protein
MVKWALIGWLCAAHCFFIKITGQKTKEERVGEKEDEIGGQKEDDRVGSLALTNHDREGNNQDQDQKAPIDDHSSRGTHTGKAIIEESRPNCVDDHKTHRPMSPGTLALMCDEEAFEKMCDEQDTMFTTSQNAAPQQTVIVNHNQSALYAEQENVVLTEFRDCLRKFVRYGRMKGTPNIFLFTMLITNLLVHVSDCFMRGPKIH